MKPVSATTKLALWGRGQSKLNIDLIIHETKVFGFPFDFKVHI